MSTEQHTEWVTTFVIKVENKYELTKLVTKIIKAKTNFECDFSVAKLHDEILHHFLQLEAKAK